MPVLSFVAEPTYDLSGTAPADHPQAAAAPRENRSRAGRKPAQLGRWRRQLTPQTRTLLMDRCEEAVAGGVIAVNPEEMECEFLDLTLAELALLFRLLFAEDAAAVVAELRERLTRRAAAG
jgi:hypothetical protein